MANPSVRPVRGSFIEVATICPRNGGRVVVQGERSESGFHVTGCTRWQDGFCCQAGCATQVGLQCSVELARQVQQMIEPPADFQIGELSVATWMSVSQGVGGDFQVVRSYGTTLRVIQGDVVGKGLSAALLAAYLVGLCDALAGEGLHPTNVLHSMNVALAERTQARPMFATVIAIEVDLVRRTWKCARAGHEQALLIRAAGPGVTFNPEPSLPVGIDGDEVYLEHEAPLLDGDRLFVGSDGALEVGLTSEMVAATLRHGSARELIEGLVSLLPLQTLRDDITLAIICCDREP